MAGILEGVDRRTQLVGENRLELLLFRLGGKQLFGINVFKVREVIHCPQLTWVPNGHRLIRGIADIRHKVISVIDLALALGKEPIAESDSSYVIISEFNRNVQGFLVSGVDRIVNLNWEAVLPPPKGTEENTYLTAVTEVDGHLVEIIDVEKVLDEVIGIADAVAPRLTEAAHEAEMRVRQVLVADDSSVARNQIRRALAEIGVECILVRDGREALQQMRSWAAEEQPLSSRIALLISDIEMPEMDGYTLTAEIRKDPRLKDTFVVLHSSLSGVFNNSMVEKVGADRFLAKFQPDELAEVVLARIHGREQSVRLAV